MESRFIFLYYFNMKCSSVQLHYDQMSNSTVTSVNLIWKKCPIHIEFSDTDFWLFDYCFCWAGAPPTCSKIIDIVYPPPYKLLLE